MALTIRPATSGDIKTLAALDHGYSTDYVWQMETRAEEGPAERVVTFRQVRLPRSMRVQFPRDPKRLENEWTRYACLLVAGEDKALKGYLGLRPGPVPDMVWAADFAVERRWRRQGVGAALFTAAARWARDNGLRRITVETQSKNFPAISFCQKHGLAFCGFSDRYYANQDIALFFGMTLR